MREKSLKNANNSQPVKIRGGETKVMKKLLSSLLVLALVLTMVTPAFAAPASDVAGTDYEDAVNRLMSLDVLSGYPDGSFKPDNSITRAEFAVVAVSLLGLEDAAKVSEGVTKFSDMTGYGWASGYINVAVQQGIISGYPDGTYKPGQPVTYAEALSILVRALGYGPATVGEWPANFLVKASEIGLTKNVKGVVANAVASRGSVALMSDNALTINMMELYYYGEGTKDTYRVVDKTILEDRLNVEKVTAIVEANENASFAAKLAKEGQVVVDLYNANGTLTDNDVVYEAGLSNVEDLLGYKTTLYVKDGEVIIAKASGNTVVTLAPADIDVDASALDAFVYTDANDDEKTVDLSSTKVLFNGQKKTSPAVIDLAPASGNLVLVSNDDDDAFEFAYVTSYETVVVDEVLVEDELIVAKGANDLDLSDEDYVYTLVKDGQEVTLEDLNEWDVLEVAEGANGDLFTITVVTDSVEGEVDEVLTVSSTTSLATKVAVDGVSYSVASDSGLDLSVGDEGVFYLDNDGKIAAFDAVASETATNYAYLVAVGKTDTTFTKNTQFKLLNTEGDTVVLNGAAKITVNGNTAVVENDNTVRDLAAGMIKYELNADGEVKIIDELDADAGDVLDTAVELELDFDADTNMLGNYVVTNKTLVFFVDTGSDDIDDTGVYGLADLEHGEGYNAEVYKTANTTLNTLDVVLIKEDSFVAAASDAEIALVNKVTTAKNSDGDTVSKLYAIVNGQEVVKYAKADLTISAVQGDVIDLTFNAKGEIASAGSTTLVNTGVAQVVYGKSNDYIVVGTAKTSYALADDVVVYTFDDTNNTVSVSTLASVKTYEQTRAYASNVKLHTNTKGLVDVIVIVK